MKTNRRNGVSWVLAGVIGTAGVTLMSGCDNGELTAIVTGVQVAADTFLEIDSSNGSSSRSTSQSLTDWLLGAIGN